MRTPYDIGFDVEKYGIKCKIKAKKGLKIPKELYEHPSYSWSYFSQRDATVEYLKGRRDFLIIKKEILLDL